MRGKAEKPRYHRTIVTVEVITDEPLEFHDLDDLHLQITEGHASGKVQVFSRDQVDRRTMRKMLAAHGTDPAFFDNPGDSHNDDDGLVTPIRWFRDPH